MKFRLLVSLLPLVLLGCDEVPQISSVPAIKPEQINHETVLGSYKIKYLGQVNVAGQLREVIEVYNAKTESTTLMIRGFGSSDFYQNGKHTFED